MVLGAAPCPACLCSPQPLVASFPGAGHSCAAPCSLRPAARTPCPFASRLWATATDCRAALSLDCRTSPVTAGLRPAACARSLWMAASPPAAVPWRWGEAAADGASGAAPAPPGARSLLAAPPCSEAEPGSRAASPRTGAPLGPLARRLGTTSFGCGATLSVDPRAPCWWANPATGPSALAFARSWWTTSSDERAALSPPSSPPLC
ncbi:hypothetical protein DIPPA_13335 [Diplonema papillatum]|nr:hypothetical protein DIPPA_13335 [Diplonema papillatum]